jgi:hypothetical protein
MGGWCIRMNLLVGMRLSTSAGTSGSGFPLVNV